DGEAPGTRPTDSANLDTGLKEHPRMQLIAPIALGLDRPEEASFLELLERFVREAPQLLHIWSTLTYGRDQGTGTIEIFFRCHGAPPAKRSGRQRCVWFSGSLQYLFVPMLSRV